MGKGSLVGFSVEGGWTLQLGWGGGTMGVIQCTTEGSTRSGMSVRLEARGSGQGAFGGTVEQGKIDVLYYY